MLYISNQIGCNLTAPESMQHYADSARNFAKSQVILTKGMAIYHFRLLSKCWLMSPRGGVVGGDFRGG